MGDHTTGYVKTALAWCQSEEHARKLLKAERRMLRDCRTNRIVLEQLIEKNLAAINAVKAKIYQQGWSE